MTAAQHATPQAARRSPVFGIFRELEPLDAMTLQRVSAPEVQPRFVFGPVTRLQRQVLGDLAAQHTERLAEYNKEVEGLWEEADALGLPRHPEQRKEVILAKTQEQGRVPGAWLTWQNKQQGVAERFKLWMNEHKLEHAAVFVRRLSGDWSLHDPELPQAPQWPALTPSDRRGALAIRRDLLLRMDGDQTDALIEYIEEAIKQGVAGLTGDEKKACAT